MTHVSLWILLAPFAVFAVVCKLLEPFLIKRMAEQIALDVAKQDSFQSKGPLLSAAELAFYRVLVRSVGSGVGIAPKVRLADLVMPAGRLSRSGWQKGFNKIAMKHADFVLFDQDSGSVIGVVELDDSSHSTFEAGARDAFKDGVLKSAGISITRFKARGSYDVLEIRAKLPITGLSQFARL